MFNSGLLLLFWFLKAESCICPDLTVYTSLTRKLRCSPLASRRTSHLAQHRVFVVWVLIVLFSGVDIEHVVSNADTAWELVFQILCRSEVLELKKVVSGKLGKSPLATTLSAVLISRFLLVTAKQLRGRRCDPLTPRRLHTPAK